MSDKLCYQLLQTYKLENSKLDLEINQNIIIEYEEYINTSI